MATKVLMFGWEFPPYNSGGLGVACLGLAQSLLKEGVDVNFVLPKKMDLDYPHLKFIFADNQSFISKEEYQYLISPYISIQAYQEFLATIKDGDFGYQKDLQSEVLKYALLAKDIAQNTPHDIIHAHDWLTVEAGLVAKEISGKPLVFHIHATEVDRTGGHGHQLIYDIEKKGMQKADQVVAVSQFTKDTIVREYGIDANKISVVHNGINFHEEKNNFGSDELLVGLQKLKDSGKKIVLFTGRITFQKGVDYLLEAAKLALDYNPNTIFVIAGSGDMEYQIINRTAELGISDKVIFPGFLRGDELKSLYKIADLYVMPSVAEPFGIAALEALVHETPLIVSKNSGVAEVVSGALKVDFWDVQEMANMISAVLDYPALHALLKDYSHQEVKKISWQAAARKLVTLYTGVLEGV